MGGRLLPDGVGVLDGDAVAEPDAVGEDTGDADGDGVALELRAVLCEPELLDDTDGAGETLGDSEPERDTLADADSLPLADAAALGDASALDVGDGLVLEVATDDALALGEDETLGETVEDAAALLVAALLTLGDDAEDAVAEALAVGDGEMEAVCDALADTEPAVLGELLDGTVGDAAVLTDTALLPLDDEVEVAVAEELADKEGEIVAVHVALADTEPATLIDGDALALSEGEVLAETVRDAATLTDTALLPLGVEVEVAVAEELAVEEAEIVAVCVAEDARDIVVEAVGASEPLALLLGEPCGDADVERDAALLADAVGDTVAATLALVTRDLDGEMLAVADAAALALTEALAIAGDALADGAALDDAGVAHAADGLGDALGDALGEDWLKLARYVPSASGV